MSDKNKFDGEELASDGEELVSDGDDDSDSILRSHAGDDLLSLLQANKKGDAKDAGAPAPAPKEAGAKGAEETLADMEDVKAREAREFLKTGPLNLNKAGLLEKERLEDTKLVARINEARAKAQNASLLHGDLLREKRVAAMKDFSAWVEEYSESLVDFESKYGELFSLAKKIGEVDEGKRPHGFPEDSKQHLKFCRKLADDLAGALEGVHENLVKLRNKTVVLRRDHEAVVVGYEAAAEPQPAV